MKAKVTAKAYTTHFIKMPRSILIYFTIGKHLSWRKEHLVVEQNLNQLTMFLIPFLDPAIVSVLPWFLLGQYFGSCIDDIISSDQIPWFVFSEQ